MPLPPGAHAVRLCSFANLGDDGEITAACFAPHPGEGDRQPDDYLSVHWLEYLSSGSIPECVSQLRQFLLTSVIPGERRPSKLGRLAVVNCDRVIESAAREVNLAVAFQHVPRPNPSAVVATGIEQLADGTMRIGIAIEQHLELGQSLDPHSGMFTLPEEASHRLAVQQFFASMVCHSEPGST